MKNQYMELAISEAAKDPNEIPVGAVLVKDKKVIATAHNETVKGNNALLHAEMLVMERGLKTLGTTYLEDCELYVTKEPCIMCFGGIVNARVKRVYFGCYDVKYGAMEYVEKLGYLHKINHVPEIYGGIMELECKTLLEDFFR